MNDLVIVESPTKAKTLQRFLGNKYQIEASMGHIRDLPKGDFGVDIENNFEPQYVIPRDKRKKVNELKRVAQQAKVLWLATDPDREGEAIAWHIAELLRNSKLKIKNLKFKIKDIKRVAFHEITPEAIKEAFENPRDIDLKLVDAQQARRVLDRLVGYKLSPLLWHKIKRGLSAGRVQSVALRLIVDREKEIEAFKPEEYWIIEATLKPAASGKDKETFVAVLVEKDSKKLRVKNEAEAKKHLQVLKKASYQIFKVVTKIIKRQPYPPFTTSTLQQAAANKLGMTARKTMMLAQALYEQGYITYMRTDSVNLSISAVEATRDLIVSKMGQVYLPPQARFYKSKSKNVQEAHEAIRPTGVTITTENLKKKGDFSKDHIRLYDLIWKRFIACQMKEAIVDQTTVDVAASGGYLLRATGSVVKFDGWLKVYGIDKNEDDKEKILPPLKEKEDLDLVNINSAQHFTEPPPRYNEASLIKKLEELGIGRPSTYAPILSVIQERIYVEKQERKFVPTILGRAVADFLLKYFPGVVDFDFTAQMEDELDEIARGERQWRPTIKEFYSPFEKLIEQTSSEAEKIQLVTEVVDQKCPDCGKNLMMRFGRFGKFLACSGFPDCKYTQGLEEKINAKCPQCGGEIVVRRTRKGKTFYGCKNWPGCKYASWTKPKSA